jgi:hypothetical protein
MIWTASLTVRDVGKRGVVELVAGLAILSACSGGSNPVAAPPTSVSSTSVAPVRTTTTTTTPEFSFDDSVPPPKLINTGKNYVAILKSLESYGNWTASHRPDPELATGFVAGGTKLFASYARVLSSLRDKEQRVVEETSGPDRVTIISATANSFSATIVQKISSHRLVDASRHVVREAHFRGPTTYLALVVRVKTRWYLASSDVTGAPERVT